MNKVSHTATMRAQYAYNRKQVLFLTGLTDALLMQFQFDTGLAWLTQYTAASDDVLRWILSQPLIWKWWINEWNRRDEEYLSLLYSLYENKRDDIVIQYYRLHRETFIERGAPWILLEDGYRRAIGELNKTTGHEHK